MCFLDLKLYFLHNFQPGVKSVDDVDIDISRTEQEIAARSEDSENVMFYLGGVQALTPIWGPLMSRSLIAM